MRLGIFLAALLTFSTPTFAQNVGLMIGNSDYAQLSNVRKANRVLAAVDELEDADMEVIWRRDATLEDTLWSLSEFGQMASEADTLLVVLSGRFVHTSAETYFMPTDSEVGALATLAQRSLPLSTVLAWLGSRPQSAALVLSTISNDTEYGPLLRDGIGALNIPEGVSVFVGGSRASTRFLANGLARVGKPYLGMARREKVNVLGYQSDTHIFLNASNTPAPTTAEDRRADILGWRNASQINTVKAYQDYIDANPRGEFVLMAENRIRGLNDTPEARAERREQSLDLSRDARRAIQRDLSLLGYNTRGIDGIFGRGSRAAIASWQTDQRLASTGFLSQAEIEELDNQAEIRAAELEAEAEKRRQEQLAADIDYWDRTGSTGSEDGLRQYLARFPDGEFAEVAIARLENIEAQKRDRASSGDRRLWSQVRQYDTIPAYEEYLRRAPNGAFREEALLRINELEAANANSSQLQAAMQREQSMNLSPRTRQIVEARLNGLDLKPGPVDGVFDDNTRRAIRRYQASRNMDETGYLSDAVVVQLLADTVRSIFR